MIAIRRCCVAKDMLQKHTQDSYCGGMDYKLIEGKAGRDIQLLYLSSPFCTRDPVPDLPSIPDLPGKTLALPAAGAGGSQSPDPLDLPWVILQEP